MIPTVAISNNAFSGAVCVVSVSVDGIGLRVSPGPVPLTPPYIFIDSNLTVCIP